MLKRVISKIRTVEIYLIGKSIYRGLKIKGKPIVISNRDIFEIDKDSAIEIGHGFAARKNTLLEAKMGGKITIGDNVFMNRECIITSFQKVSIGDRCVFGPNVRIYDHDHGLKAHKVDLHSFTAGDVEIGEDCWIGTGVIILKNTRIGKGTVIGAGCIIKGEIPENSIVKSDRTYNVEYNRAE